MGHTFLGGKIMRRSPKILSTLLIIVIFLSAIPLDSHAEKSIKIKAPTINVETDKSSYGALDTAKITVTVLPSDGFFAENVSVSTKIGNQLSAVDNSSVFFKETTLLTDKGLSFSFYVVASKNANGLNLFQKIIIFIKRLFNPEIIVPSYNFNDDRAIIISEETIKFGNVDGKISISIWYNDTISEKDSDADGLIDYIEIINGSNINLSDTDNDGVSDYDEFVILGTDLTKSDTDENGVNDFDDDNDLDGLSNGFELQNGTNPNVLDTDCDGLGDGDELSINLTSPILYDTDNDGAGDGWEVEHGYNPKKYDNIFNITTECETEELNLVVNFSTSGQNTESAHINPVKNNILIDPSIPGYLGNAFEINATGDIGIAKISFEFDKELLENPEFDPTVYCLNEETQTFYEYETKVNGNIATAQSTHFSTYILLDKTVFERHLNETYNVDYSVDSGIDSNNDGITDYVTKLMCDGVIRSGTGTKIFGDKTYEEIQSNNDFDNDGVVNGEEIYPNYYIDIPDDAIEYNGHYYKLFDIGYIWDDAEAYCESIGGYLATITSQEEQQAVENILESGNKNSYWLGARKTGSEFKWVSGEQMTYTNWASDQPDNHANQEETLMIYKNRNPLCNSTNTFGRWNDLLNDGTCKNEAFFGLVNFGFICEWGTYEVNKHSYTFINSSPITNDTDKDGFIDKLDPTPNKADAFASMTYYKKYYFDNVDTITLFVKQPIWDSRTCYTDDVQTTTGYYSAGHVGHSYLGLDYIDETQKYFGFYPNNAIYGSSANLVTTVLRRPVDGVWSAEDQVFSVAKTFIIDKKNIDLIENYWENHKKDKYKIAKNNCTTAAINILKHINLNPKIYEHVWSGDGLVDILTGTFYGYSPADAAEDIKANYCSYIYRQTIELNDGTTVWAIKVNGNPLDITDKN